MDHEIDQEEKPQNSHAQLHPVPIQHNISIGGFVWKRGGLVIQPTKCKKGFKNAPPPPPPHFNSSHTGFEERGVICRGSGAFIEIRQVSSSDLSNLRKNPAGGGNI